LRDKRQLNIIDEIEEKEKIQRIHEEAEAKRDLTYEEFLTRYQDMIDGKYTSVKDTLSAHDKSRPVTGHHVEEENKGDTVSEKDKKRRAANSSAMSKGSNASGPNTMNNTKEGFDIKDDLRFDIPDTCFLILMKGNKIAKLDKSFKLLSHPFPLIEGEMILF
jgi:hypothetical protein